MAQWITRLTTDQEIPGSTPGKLDLLGFKEDSWYHFVIAFKDDGRLDSEVSSARVS